VDDLPPDFTTLNSLAVLRGIRFKHADVLDSMIVLTTEDDIEIVFPASADLNDFGKAQYHLRARRHLSAFTSQPADQRPVGAFPGLVYRMVKAKRRVRLEDPLKEETRNNLRLMWRRTGEPVAADNGDFIPYGQITRSCFKQSRFSARGQFYYCRFS
jgi:hypothetical protein